MNIIDSYQYNKESYHADDTLLLHEFNVRNQYAFRFIFENNYRPAVLFAQGILNNYEYEAEDIVQDAFIKLWNKNEVFSTLAAIKSYVYITVKNACLDKLRKNQVADKYQGHAEKQLQLLEADFIEPLITAETTKLIQQAIEGLPEQGKLIFKLSLSGKKNNEIAEELNISVNTVKTHKQRALSSLRHSLGDSLLIILLLHYNNFI